MFKKNRKSKLSDGVEVRYHWKNILWSLIPGPLIYLAAFLFQNSFLLAISLPAILFGIMMSIYFSNSPYFNYNEERVLKPPYKRIAFGKREIFVIESPEDIKVEAGKVKVKYKENILDRITTYADKNGEPNKVIARKSRAHPDDWEKLENWVKDLQCQAIKH